MKVSLCLLEIWSRCLFVDERNVYWQGFTQYTALYNSWLFIEKIALKNGHAIVIANRIWFMISALLGCEIYRRWQFSFWAWINSDSRSKHFFRSSSVLNAFLQKLIRLSGCLSLEIINHECKFFRREINSFVTSNPDCIEQLFNARVGIL